MQLSVEFEMGKLQFYPSSNMSINYKFASARARSIESRDYFGKTFFPFLLLLLLRDVFGKFGKIWVNSWKLEKWCPRNSLPIRAAILHKNHVHHQDDCNLCNRVISSFSGTKFLDSHSRPYVQWDNTHRVPTLDNSQILWFCGHFFRWHFFSQSYRL